MHKRVDKSSTATLGRDDGLPNGFNLGVCPSILGLVLLVHVLLAALNLAALDGAALQHLPVRIVRRPLSRLCQPCVVGVLLVSARTREIPLFPLVRERQVAVAVIVAIGPAAARPVAATVEPTAV